MQRLCAHVWPASLMSIMENYSTIVSSMRGLRRAPNLGRADIRQLLAPLLQGSTPRVRPRLTQTPFACVAPPLCPATAPPLRPCTDAPHCFFARPPTQEQDTDAEVGPWSMSSKVRSS